MRTFLFYAFICLQLFSNHLFAQNCFSIGSSMNDVKTVQGTPTAINNRFGGVVWDYNYSSITFLNGVVKEYSDISKNLKICRSSSYSTASCISIGSSMNEVNSVQGTPTAINNRFGDVVWDYDYSSITFKDGIVSEYSNISKNLKICHTSSSSTASCILIGSSMNDVKTVQGTPTAINNRFGGVVWDYNYSSVTFQNGVVTEYSNISRNLKICNPSSNFNASNSGYVAPVEIKIERNEIQRISNPIYEKSDYQKTKKSLNRIFL